MSDTGETLRGTFGTTDYLMPLVLDDMPDELAKTRSRDGSGPSVAWIVGHMLFYRHNVLEMLGDGRGQPYAAFNESATDGSDYPTIEELHEQWTALAPDFTAAVMGKSEEEWNAEGTGAHDERSLREQIIFFAWHEGYHMGALGSIRKSLGLAGPAEKVMAAREAAAVQADEA